MGGIARIFTPEAKLKKGIRAHFTRLGFTKADDGTLILPEGGKEVVRQLHAGQRAERLRDSREFLKRALPEALPHFASGAELDPSKIQLGLIRVHSGTKDADLFRVASFTWSVPVSAGFGRRMRYLVWDHHHGRLAGIIALGDPVYNLSVRDKLVGWSVEDRAKRLVNLLDAYVLGAVAPYNMLLTGKVVACLVRSREVFDDFKASYGSTVGIISNEAKRANLLAVTTTSSMGRSSIYNRLRLDGTTYFDAIGYTIGWGHFHITDDIFGKMRDYLRLSKHPYADKHNFGEGPNWRLRTIKVALKEIGINESVLRHGIQREVFISSFCKNSISILKKGKGKPNLDDLKTVDEISELAKNRWIVPRAERRDDYKQWDRSQIRTLIRGTVAAAEKPLSANAA
ncbi:hypothetical protein ASE11_17720 [Hydrogenophaga sp. Root209]|uniref:Druantia anti-phage system protein DruA n=1 Tax=Hydrogenophaga sp. Root209 TaxID=1736490 RepID=UPI0007005867|nr:Druantia anti-phage system protein DruA [Hydrogenophaga sp. Root209]KRB96408.1 hypothetical protein ASE11_17720 [Hydrogenophaga sp. Root209]